MITDPLFDIRGKVALVTGASSGLGENFARSLAARGADRRRRGPPRRSPGEARVGRSGPREERRTRSRST